MASFMDLPAEMRNSIYHELYVCNAVDGESTPLTTSKLINEEAASYYYQHNVLMVSLPPAPGTYAGHILSPISNQYLKYIRRLSIDVCLNTSRTVIDECAQRIVALADSDATLSALTIRFSSTTSKILCNRVDDAVLHAEHPITLALRHALSSSIARATRLEFDNVWFAPGLAAYLQGLSQGSLEVATSTYSIERSLLRQTTQDHLHDLDLDEQDVEDAEDLLPPLYGSESSSVPSPLSSALSDLDTFSPAAFAYDEEDEYADAFFGALKDEKVDSLFDEPFFEKDEELDETDDVGDEEMQDIDDIEAIFGNMEETMHYRTNEADVCYMANFAPALLGRWLEESS